MSRQPIREINGGLTVQEARFCTLYCSGIPPIEAAREAFYLPRTDPQRLYEKVSRLLRKPQVAARCRTLLADARIQDIDSVGRCLRELLADIESARTAKNWTAVAALNRIRASVHGMLRDSVTVTHETAMSDEELIRRLAGDDQQKATTLRAILGPSGFGQRGNEAGAATS